MESNSEVFQGRAFFAQTAKPYVSMGLLMLCLLVMILFFPKRRR